MDAEEKKRTPEVPASPSAPAPAQQPAAPAPSGGAFSNITPVQLDAAARAAAKQDVDRTLELADGLDIQLNDRFKSYDDDRKAALQYVTAAGIAFEHSLANAAGAPDLASRERVSLAADELGRRWAEYNGLADYRGADVVLDRNGQVHVRFNVGGKWTDDPEFGIERGPDGFPRKTGAQPFDYGKMHDYMTENGYLGQLGDADLEDAGKAAAEAAAATAAPDKPWADESAFYKAGEAIPEWQRGAWYEKNAPVMFGDEEGKAIAARYAEYAKSKQSGGKPGNSVDALLSGAVPPPAEGKGGETPASGVDLNAVSKGASAPEGGNPPAPVEPPASNALRKEGDNPEQTMEWRPDASDGFTSIDDVKRSFAKVDKKEALQPLGNSDLQETDPLAAAFAAKPGETAASKPAAEARADKAKARREAGAAAAARMNEKARAKPTIDFSDEKTLAKVESNLKKQGFVVREVNGEYYMWHPKAKVWMASDGHTVVERNGTFVDSGVAKGKLSWTDVGRKILKANGPGGQGNVEETVLPGQKHDEDIPENVIKYLQFKNGENGGFSDDPGDEEEANARTEGRVSAFESGANGEKGSLTLARRFNNFVAEAERATVRDEDGELDDAGMRATFKNTMAIQKDLIAQFDALSDEEKHRFLSSLSDYGAQEFRAAQNIVRVDAAYNAIVGAKTPADIAEAFKAGGIELSDKSVKKLQDAYDADVSALIKNQIKIGQEIADKYVDDDGYIADEEEWQEEFGEYIDNFKAEMKSKLGIDFKSDKDDVEFRRYVQAWLTNNEERGKEHMKKLERGAKKKKHSGVYRVKLDPLEAAGADQGMEEEEQLRKKKERRNEKFGRDVDETA